MYGMEHPSTLNTINILAILLKRQGNFEEAKAMYHVALEGFEKIIGHEHPCKMPHVSNLVACSRNKGRS